MSSHRSVDEQTPLLREAGEGTVYHSNGDLRDTERRENGTDDDQTSAAAIKPRVAAIMIPMSIGIFLAALDNTIIASSYASIGNDLKQLQNTSWIATGYMLTMTSFQPLYGKLSDIFGRKSCLISAYLVFGLGCLACGLARNMTELIMARALAGIGGGGMTTVSVITLSDVVPLRQRGVWQGIGNMVFAAGMATGAPLGGFLADSIGWRWAFFLQVPLTIVATLSVAFGLNLPKVGGSDFKANLKRVDFLGAFTLVGAVFFLLLGLDRGGNVSWNDTFTIASLVAFAVLLVFFVVVEVKVASEPFAPKRIVANPALLANYICSFCCIGSMMSSIFNVSLYLQAVHGLTARSVGVTLLPAILGGVTGSLGSGLLMRAVGKFYALTVSAAVMQAVGIAVVMGMTGVVTYSFAGIAVGLALGNIGNGTVLTTTLVALIAHAGSEDQAVATAVSYLFRSLGSVVCISVGTTISQNTLRKRLFERISEGNVDEIIARVRESLKYIDELEPAVRAKVRASYSDGTHAAMWFCLVVAACSIISAIFVKEKSLSQ